MLAELTRQSTPDPFLDFGQALGLPEICLQFFFVIFCPFFFLSDTRARKLV